MARVELIMPKMGESVSEATVISWTKEVGEMVEMDETIVEIATDKVDSEVPSTHEGKLVEKLFETDEVVQVGEPFAILEIEGGDENLKPIETAIPESDQAKVIEQEVTETIEKTTSSITNSGDRFYSPLVRSMASEEGIEMSELESIPGTGKDGRVTKTDMTNYLKFRGESNDNPVKVEETKQSCKSCHFTCRCKTRGNRTNQKTCFYCFSTTNSSHCSLYQ